MRLASPEGRLSLPFPWAASSYHPDFAYPLLLRGLHGSLNSVPVSHTAWGQANVNVSLRFLVFGDTPPCDQRIFVPRDRWRSSNPT